MKIWKSRTGSFMVIGTVEGDRHDSAHLTTTPTPEHDDQEEV